MALWFSASAVIPQLSQEWGLTGGQKSWLTMSVQAGFVVGALLSAVLNLADRMDATRLIGVSALIGAMANGAIPWFDMTAEPALAMRFVTGMALAGVYPPGMKIVATWCREDRGYGIGLLVGAITVGSASPHLLNTFPIAGDVGMPPWRAVLYVTSALAGIAGILALAFVRSGPYFTKLAPFDWRFIGRALTH
ncbi:MAG: MFS transporter, partial [Candidatus Krumholzibacteriota bacterium]|nr:MFS transporter [Candidatus Krumholzibacteriota bacterium]